jgi:hypothetical protein
MVLIFFKCTNADPNVLYSVHTTSVHQSDHCTYVFSVLFSGVMPAQMGAIRLQSAALKEESGHKMTRESMQARLRCQQFMAASVAAASILPLQALPTPIPCPVSRKALYACHVCNVKGHWKGHGKFRPEDILAHLVPLLALIHPAAGDPPAPGTSSSGTELKCVHCSCSMSCITFLGA